MMIKYFLLGLCVWSKTAVVAAQDEIDCDPAPIKSQTLLSWKQQEDESLLKLEWEEETMKMLSKIDSEIAVVSITGPRRSDNSDFLNRIANEIYTQTKGESDENRDDEWKPPFNSLSEEVADILVYILPGCTHPLPDNPGTTLLMIDTPGMWTHQRLAMQDAQVMALVESVSSVVLYNTHWPIDRHELQLISTALETTRALDSLSVNGDTDDKAQEGAEEEDEQTSAMMDHPTSLIWLLRSSPKSEGQNPIDYVKGIQETSKQGKGLKDLLESFSTKQEAFALPYPKASDDQPDLDTRNDENDLKHAIKAILNGCNPKKVHDSTSTVNGETLVKFMMWFSKTVNVQSGDDDSPTGLLEVLEDEELATMTTKYRAGFESDMPLDSDVLESTREKVEKDLRSAIVPRSPKGDEAEPTSLLYKRRDVFDKKFNRLMSTLYEEMREANLRKTAESELKMLQEV